MNSDHPDLILLDIMLPDGNGVDICRKLKSQEATSAIPIVLMSAHMDRAVLDCGAEDFIAKPFDIDDLVARINFQMESGI